VSSACQQYSIQAKGVSQNVSVDKNVVSYHVVKNEVEAWIVDDFDKVSHLKCSFVLFQKMQRLLLH
jgi:hypothetical protein